MFLLLIVVLATSVSCNKYTPPSYYGLDSVGILSDFKYEYYPAETFQPFWMERHCTKIYYADGSILIGDNAIKDIFCVGKVNITTYDKLWDKEYGQYFIVLKKNEIIDKGKSILDSGKIFPIQQKGKHNEHK